MYLPFVPVLMASLAGAGTSQAREASRTEVAAVPAPAAADEWTTWGYDPERTAWNRGEHTLSTSNVSKLKVQWSTKLSTPVTDVALSTLTSPIIAAGVSTPQGTKDLLFLLGADDVLFALDADSGAVIWQKGFPNPVRARKNATWLCPGTANATPVVDKARGLIFVMASDGKLRAHNLADGAERMAPMEMVAPFTRAWSLNLIDDVVYTTSGRACGEVQDPRSAMASAVAPIVRRGGAAATADPAGPPVMTDPSAVTAIDVRDLASPQLTRFYTSGGRPAGPWGRGGLARGPGNTLILQTSDGLFDPGAGSWGDTILKLTPKATRVADSFTPENFKYIFAHDLAGSASPVVFPFGGKTLVATAQKEGVLYLLDANDMGGGQAKNHAMPVYKSPQLGNDAAAGTDPSQGVWGAITTYETPEGKRYLYLPMWGPRSKDAPAFRNDAGASPNGSIMAFQVVSEADKISLTPEWVSGNMIMPDPPVVANGVVYATQTGGQAMQNPNLPDGSRLNSATVASARYRSTPVGNMILYAFDAETGKQLYSSKDAIPDWTHFSEPVVALGKVFLVAHDARVYALGVGKGARR
jgi:outer membrane protein assembly factor BamB